MYILPHHKKYFTIIILIIFSCTQHIAQTVERCFIDQTSGMPISNLVVDDGNGNMIISNLDGFVQIDTTKIDYDNSTLFTVLHLSYNQIKLSYESFLEKDTVALAQTVIDIQEITVLASRNPVNPYKLVNEVLRNMRRLENEAGQAHFAFYLETKIDGKPVEKIKSIFSQEGISGKKEYIPRVGEFWYDSVAPFLNLDSDKWLNSYHPYEKRPRRSPYRMLTNVGGLNQRLAKINVIDRSDDEVLLDLIDEGAREHIRLRIDLEHSLASDIRYTKIQPREITFLGLNSHDTISVDSIEVSFKIDPSGRIGRKEFSLNITNKGRSQNLHIRGFMYRLKDAYDVNQVTAGGFRPANLYDFMIHQPYVNQSLLETAFDTVWYKGYKIDSHDELWKSTYGDYRKFWNIAEVNSNFKVYDGTRLTAQEISISPIPGFSSGGRALRRRHFTARRTNNLPFEDYEYDVSWVVDASDTDPKQTSFVSIPSIWNIKRNIVFTPDSLDAIYIGNVLFDLFEIERRSMVNRLNERPPSIQDLKKTVESEHDIAIAKILPIIRKLKSANRNLRGSNTNFEFRVEINDVIKKDLGVDRIKENFLNELSYSFVNHKYVTCADRYLSLAEKYRELNDEERAKKYAKTAVGLYQIYVYGYRTSKAYSLEKMLDIYKNIVRAFIAMENFVAACNSYHSGLELRSDFHELFEGDDVAKRCGDTLAKRHE